jgi:hypothetical protein
MPYLSTRKEREKSKKNKKQLETETIRLETMEYTVVDAGPNQRRMKIELKQDENGNKLIQITQVD